MRVLVTGASGFLGSGLARELVAQGHDVRVLVREGSDCRMLRGLRVQKAIGDLLNRESLDAALDGCDWLFHMAAVYALWTPEPAALYETNVGGTARLLEAAMAAGIQRVVYTSTESTIGISRNGTPGTEDGQVALSQLTGHYKRSKLLAERLALEFGRRGLPVVVVNPTVPVGPGDVKPTPTGQFIVDFLNGRMPAYVDTGLNLVDVADVAKGHILAMERGRQGERYLLGHRNVTFREMLEVLAALAGLKAPSFRIPLWAAAFAALLDEGVLAPLSRRPPRIPIAGVWAARKYRHFDCSKAIRELGLPQSPVEVALEQAVRWFRENGYAR